MTSESLVYYLGVEGTFTHAAALDAFECGQLVGCRDIAAIFEALAQSPAAHGVVPIENSIEGSVNLTLDTLTNSPDLIIQGERILPIEQCLLGAGPIESVTEIHSHPHALAQCRRWIRAHLPHASLVSTGSTAQAAHDVAGVPGAAAIASALAGSYARTPVLARGIQDQAENATRFVLLGRERIAPTGDDKTSLVLGAPHERGALYRILGVFDRENVNLCKIESRPRGGPMWEYVFYADLEGHQEDDNVARALAQLRTDNHLLRLLGSYPKARVRVGQPTSASR